MSKLLDFLFHGCWHKWKILHEVPVWDADMPDAKRPMGYKFICQCEKCGQPKSFNMY